MGSSTLRLPAPFGSYPRGARKATGVVNRRYERFSFVFRSEVDGLQAGVEYLDTFEETSEETPLSKIHRKSLNRLGQLQRQNRDADRERRKRVAKPPEQPATVDTESIFPPSDFDFYPHDSDALQLFQDGTVPSSAEANSDLCKIQLDYHEGNDWDSLGLSDNSYAAPTPTQEQSTGVACGSVPTDSHEERGYASQHHTRGKELPTINEVPSEDITNVEIGELPPIAKKMPQKSQWATLQELRLSSRVHYMKFLRLTANDNSRGIKMLRRMYGSPKGMLDAGITTFQHVLDGQEPQSLKEIFAFTCLSYVMSKLLQKHGRMEGSQVLADVDRWRLAIKKEKDRLVYDQVVKILWPEIEFLKEHSKEKDSNSTPPPTEPPAESHLRNMDSLGLTFNAPNWPLYVPSLMLAYGMTGSPDSNFLERSRAADCSNIEYDMQSALQDPGSWLDVDDQLHDHGLHDHLIGLLQETSAHESFMFADFLNFCDSEVQNNIAAAPEKQSRDIIPTTLPPRCPPQIFPSNEPICILDPKKLGNSSTLIAGSGVLVQKESLPPKADEVPTVPPLLGILIDTIMFQVAVEFMKFITGLGDLLFRLSGSGITSRRKKHTAEGYTRPIQLFGEFVTAAVELVLEPIKEDLSEADESVDVVLCMADAFVRFGHLQTVREIEEYIITTARNLACDFTSFTTLVSKTLKRCLAASNRITWDHIYPNYAADQEEYSNAYIKKTEAKEIAWALQNLEREDHGEYKDTFTTINVIQTAEPISPRRESNSTSISDSLPSKKQRLSPPSPNSSNERQSSTTPASTSGGDLPTPSKAYCHYANCKKLYTGRDARVNLRRHIRTAHEVCKVIKCPSCTHESSRRDNVRKHFLKKHKGDEMPAALMFKTRA